MLDLLPSLLFFAGILIIIRISHILFHNYFTPLSLYGGAWCILFAAFNLHWVKFISIETTTWVLFYGSLFGFMLGAVIIVLRSLRKPTFHESIEIEWATLINSTRYTIGFTSLFILGMLGFFYYMRTMVALYGFSAFITNPATIRIGQDSIEFHEQFGFVEYALVNLNMLIVVLAFTYYVIVGLKSKGFYIYLMGFTSLISTLFMAQRTNFFGAVLISVLMHLYMKPPKHLSIKTMIGFGVVVAILLGVFVFIAQSLGKTATNDRAVISYVPSGLEFLLDPYIYLTGTVPAFQAYMNETTELTWGTYTLLPITKIVASVFPQVRVPAEITPYYPVPFLFNATTFLSVFYSDWGVVGVIFAPFLLGLISTSLYIRMRQASNLPLIFINSLLAYCLIYSVFNSRFISTYIWEFALVGYFFLRYTLVSHKQVYYRAYPTAQSMAYRRK